MDVEVVEELRKAGELQEVKLKEKLQATWELNRKLDALAKDKEEKLAAEKALVDELRVKLGDTNLRSVVAEVRVGKLEIEVEAARHAVTWAIDEYKKFEDFKHEVDEGYIKSLHLIFLECKKKWPNSFLNWI